MFYDKLTVILSCEEPQSRYLGVSTAPDKINKSYFGRSFHWTFCTCGCPFNTRVEKNVKHFRHRPQGIRIFSKTKIFFLVLAFRPYVDDAFSAPTTHVKTRPRGEILKTSAFTCGRTETEVFEYDDVIHHIPLALRMLSYFHRLIAFVWTGQNDSNTLCVDGYFLKMEKKYSFSKISAYVLTGP